MYALVVPSLGPERRGALVQAFTEIDERKITDRSEIASSDYIVILDDTLAHDGIAGDSKDSDLVIISTIWPEKYVHRQQDLDSCIAAFDATALALQVLKKQITNTAMFGTLIAVFGIISLESAVKGMQAVMRISILAGNIEILKRAYELNRGNLR